jgi:hypothetical protein
MMLTQYWYTSSKFTWRAHLIDTSTVGRSMDVRNARYFVCIICRHVKDGQTDTQTDLAIGSYVKTICY